ncbi:MAG: hypothetical protein COB73_07865 [Flavobacteriaceae bacterium]|nr:MAG: hypothetical protein COB73_07865 [Flavobacteriaceae bacterium]
MLTILKCLNVLFFPCLNIQNLCGNTKLYWYYTKISVKQKWNRNQLQKVMLANGFRNYPKEWWHFTLRNEPFSETYFDFVVK